MFGRIKKCCIFAPAKPQKTGEVGEWLKPTVC